MKKNILLLIFVLSFLINLFMIPVYSQSYYTNISILASATILPKQAQGVTNAVIIPVVVRSNQLITVYALAEGSPTNIQVFFNGQPGVWSLSGGPNIWSNTINAFPNQVSYTAGFYTAYTDDKVTNSNMVTYRVDNTGPVIVSSSPSNGEIVKGNNWVLDLTFQDPGGAGLNYISTVSNTEVIFTSLGSFTDSTNDGVFSNMGPNQIRFTPTQTIPLGEYTVVCFPVDNVDNTNRAMSDTNNFIRFMHVASAKIKQLTHKFERNTQLTPGVPLEVYLEGDGGFTSYFEILGSSIGKVSLIETFSNSGIYKGIYVIKKEDYVRDGIVRAYLTNASSKESVDAEIPIDIGEVVEANRGKDLFIVSTDDVYTRILIPDGSIKEDVTVQIEKMDLWMDRYAYDFTMKTYPDNKVVEYFEEAVTLYIHYTMKEDGKVEKLNRKEEKLSEEATMLFFDRVKWLKVGGEFDLEKDIITGQVKHFSVFALGIDTISGEMVVAPNPFTPNQDNDFDLLHFICDIPSGENEKAEIKIYSMDGFLRESLTLEDGTLNNRTVDIIWDGQDERNQDCPPGLYIYQARIGNKRYRGTFVLAR